MTALRTLSLPFPPEGRSPVPTPPRWGTAGSIMSGACWVLPAPGSLREKKDSPPPMASHEAPRPPPCPPSLWGGGTPTASPPSRAAKSSGEGLKLPRWGCKPSGFTVGVPARAQGWSGRHLPQQHPPAPQELPAPGGTGPCQHRLLPCSPSRRSWACSLDKQMFWLATLKRKQAMTVEIKTQTLPNQKFPSTPLSATSR